MNRQILFIQGGGAGVHDAWDAKLVESLQRELGKDYEIRYPRMPNEDDPSCTAWKPAIERELEALQAGAILVGHSVGGTILVKTLMDRSPHRRFGAILLIAAPFAGTGGWPSDEVQFPTDLGAHLPEDVPIHFWHGLDDEIVPPSHIDLYARTVPQDRVHCLPGRDHQLDNDMKEVAATITSLQGRR